MDFAEAATIYNVYKATSVSTEIHPNDTMYRTGPDHYNVVGESAIQVILSALTVGWTIKVHGTFGLPCGHGRVARHLRAAFPNAELFFCDVNREAADFCAAQFDDHSIYAQSDLLKAQLPRDICLTWVGSLFTHIDRHRTTQWLAFLAERLRENGSIIATFQGYFSNKVTDFGDRVNYGKLDREFSATGYGYSRYKDWEENYGVSLSKPSAVMDIVDSIPDIRVMSYTERGWANNHDTLCLTRADRLKPWGR